MNQIATRDSIPSSRFHVVPCLLLMKISFQSFGVVRLAWGMKICDGFFDRRGIDGISKKRRSRSCQKRKISMCCNTYSSSRRSNCTLIHSIGLLLSLRRCKMTFHMDQRILDNSHRSAKYSSPQFQRGTISSQLTLSRYVRYACGNKKVMIDSIGECN